MAALDRRPQSLACVARHAPCVLAQLALRVHIGVVRFRSVFEMSGADIFGLVVSVLVIAYLFYALIRGEKL
jgi:K+-transporting ATPase KdpF subunit